MKKIKTVFMAVAFACAIVSCSETNDVKPPVNVSSKSNGAFLLYQGQMYDKIDGCLDFLDYSKSEMVENVFKNVNSRPIGDTPQCGIVYGDMVYIGTADSNTIEIMDRESFKSIKQISLQNSVNGQTPRSMVAYGGKVYISMFDGFVARLDTLSLAIDASVKVGPNPEIIAIHNSKIYVPNSDGNSYATTGYGKTASVVSLNPFKVEKTIEVPLNPYQFISAGQHLYLISKGDYIEEKAALYEIDNSGGNQFIANASMGCQANGKVYFADPIWGRTDTRFGIYNPVDESIKELNISNVEYPCGMNVDDKAGKLIIASYQTQADYPLYTLPGYVCEFDVSGNFLNKYRGGIGPADIFFDK